MTIISLTDAEIFFAAQIGMLKQIEDVQRNKKSSVISVQMLIFLQFWISVTREHFSVCVNVNSLDLKCDQNKL